MKLTLSNVLQTEEAKRLDTALLSKGQSPVLKELGSPENTLRFIRACMRGSYLFGRHVVPSYVSHVFASLTKHAPAIDRVGSVLRKITDMCIGELSTNNIFNREKDCHAHFNDLCEAYQEAGGKVKEFALFMALAEKDALYLPNRTQSAIAASPSLWTKGSAQFANTLLECCDNALTSFILMPCNELLTTIIYPVALEHLSTEARFDKFRRFLEVHVQLDGDEHGYAALEWLELYLRQAKVTDETKFYATNKVLSLYERD